MKSTLVIKKNNYEDLCSGLTHLASVMKDCAARYNVENLYNDMRRLGENFDTTKPMQISITLEQEHQIMKEVNLDSGIKTPSLKDFIGKECNIFGVGDDDMPMWNSGVTLSNVERGGNLETHHFIYMGSDDACHIIQRKIDGEPDGIFFFPKAAVALRF